MERKPQVTCGDKHHSSRSRCVMAVVPSLLAQILVLGKTIFPGTAGWWGGRDGFGIIQAHCIQARLLLCTWFLTGPGWCWSMALRLGTPVLWDSVNFGGRMRRVVKTTTTKTNMSEMKLKAVFNLT